jgi:hypothetical protein
MCRQTLGSVHALGKAFRQVVRDPEGITDMYRHLDTLAEATDKACQSTPPYALLQAATIEALKVIGVTDLTFSPYTRILSGHGDDVTKHRLMYLMCSHIEAEHVLCEVKKSGLASDLLDAVVCMTYPLWLTETGENTPEAIAHETMCKPEDVGPALLPSDPVARARLEALFLTHAEARKVALILMDLTEADLQDMSAQPGTMSSDVERLCKKLRAKPIWSMIFADLRACAFGHLDQGPLDVTISGLQVEAVNEDDRLAAQFYLSVLSANAANSANAACSM